MDNRMKLKVKDVVLIIALIAVAVLSTLYTRARQAEASRHSVQEELTDSIRYLQRANGQIVAEKAAAEASREDLKKYYSAELARMEGTLGVQLRNMRTYIESSLQTRGGGTAPARDTTVLIDTVYVTGKYTQIREPYFHYDGVTAGGLTTYEYTVFDSLMFAVEYKDPAFKKPSLSIRAASRNPNTRITYLRNLSPQLPAPKRWAVVVGGSLVYTDRPVFGPAVSLGYKVIEF